MTCVFCSIANGEIPAEKLLETETVIALRDIRPKAPQHILIIPKKHIASVNDVTEDDSSLMGSIIVAAKEVARKAGIAETGYKLVYNVGSGAGQLIDHLHLHVLGGWNQKDIRELP